MYTYVYVCKLEFLSIYLYIYIYIHVHTQNFIVLDGLFCTGVGASAFRVGGGAAALCSRFPALPPIRQVNGKLIKTQHKT